MASPGTAKIYRLSFKQKRYRYIFAVQEFRNFLTRDLVTLNNTRSISYSPRPLAAGPAQQNSSVWNSASTKFIFVMIHMIWSHIIRVNWRKLENDPDHSCTKDAFLHFDDRIFGIFKSKWRTISTNDKRTIFNIPNKNVFFFVLCFVF